MPKEVRTVCYDAELCLEAYRFEGIVQPFPSHFHGYYVIGVVEAGTRCLICNHREYMIGKGTVLLFNPNDTHSCVQSDGGTFCYSGLNIAKETMRSYAKEITGQPILPVFLENVINDNALCQMVSALHQSVMDDEMSAEFEKEEKLLLLTSMLIEQYGQPFSGEIPEYSAETERVCAWILDHYPEHITLQELCACSGLCKSSLLRAFTKAKGVTPYRYLQTVRIEKAKELLEQGVSPVDAAVQTGFSDQSHFTKFFHSFIGLSPAAYRRVFFGK